MSYQARSKCNYENVNEKMKCGGQIRSNDADRTEKKEGSNELENSTAGLVSIRN